MKKLVAGILLIAGVGLMSLANTQSMIIRMGALGYGGGRSSSNSNQTSSLTGDGGELAYDDNGNPIANSNFDYKNLEFGTGTQFNYLALLDHVGKGTQTTQQQKYYKNLIEAYVASSEGKYSNSTFPASPSFLAGMHKNETGWGEYLIDFAGDTHNGKMIDLRESDEAMVASLIPNYKSKVSSSAGGVWVDKENKDGYPDGPFQVEMGGPTKAGFTATTSKTPASFDTYSFRDQMNVASVTYDKGKSNLLASDTSASNMQTDMYGAGLHNRGSYIRQAYGIGYTVSSSGSPLGTYLKDTKELSSSNMKEVMEVFNIVEKTFQVYNLPILDEYNSKKHIGSTVAWVILLKDGWNVESVLGTHVDKGITDLYLLSPDLNPILKLFPEWTTEEICRSEIASKYTKPLTQALALTPEEVDKRYGTLNGSYRERVASSQGGRYGSYSFIYKAYNEVNSNYVTEGTRLVKAYDAVACQYWINVGMVGEFALVELALKAGMPEMINGSIIDPSNPQIFYTSGSGTYNPMYGNNSDGVNSVLGLLQQPVKGLQAQTLLEASNEAGLPYVWGGAGRYCNGGQNMGHKAAGRRNANKFYMTGKPFEGRRMYDCSTHASVAASIGDFSEAGPAKYSHSTADWAGNIGVNRTVKVNGQDTDVTLRQVLKDGTVSTSSFVGGQTQLLQDWVSVAQPGDILTHRGAEGGHTTIFYGRNNTGADVVIPTELTLSNYDNLTIKSGAGVTLNNGGGTTGELRSGLENANDTRRYFLMRLECNTK